MDLHCQEMMDDFLKREPVFKKAREFIQAKLKELMDKNGIYVVAIESRVKDPKSLEGKLERKGYKYNSIDDITDLVGARIITFYTTEVDKIASIVAKTFDVDWNESIDKRKSHSIDQFGYMSLHYICRIPKELYCDPEHPIINSFRFEIQMRTALQHVWSTVDHDFGYKTSIEVPPQYARKLIRLASLLEVADEEFSELLNEITEYRRNIQKLISCGSLDQIPLSLDSLKAYFDTNPLQELNDRIASINNAEIVGANFEPYLPALREIGIETLADFNNLLKDCSDDAFHLAAMQLGQTDLDILSATVGLRNLCAIHILKSGKGLGELARFFSMVDGKNGSGSRLAETIMKYAEKLNLA